MKKILVWSLLLAACAFLSLSCGSKEESTASSTTPGNAQEDDPMVASVNGEDFVPFHESVFHKGAGNGLPTAWHQDGRTHWTEEGEALEVEGEAIQPLALQEEGEGLEVDGEAIQPLALEEEGEALV